MVFLQLLIYRWLHLLDKNSSIHATILFSTLLVPASLNLDIPNFLIKPKVKYL